MHSNHVIIMYIIISDSIGIHIWKLVHFQIAVKTTVKTPMILTTAMEMMEMTHRTMRRKRHQIRAQSQSSKIAVLNLPPPLWRVGRPTL